MIISAFESKEEISLSLKSHLQEVLSTYGFTIINALVTDLAPDARVKDGKSSPLSNESFHQWHYFTLYNECILTILIHHLKISIKAMNEINASKRMKEAAYQRAEGEKVVKVKRAEAEAESMYLSGVGVARSRKAIMDGLK